MKVNSLALDQHGVSTFVATVDQLWSFSALDDFLKKALRENTAGRLDDDTVQALFEAAHQRRSELSAAAVPSRRRPAKWGTRLVTAPKLSLLEKRDQARTRNMTAGWFSAKLEKVGASVAEIYAALPRASVRAVLHTVCELAALSRGRCDASIASIAVRAGCSRSATEQALSQLRKLGYITIESGKSLGTSSIVRPVPAPLLKLVEWCRQRIERAAKKAKAAEAAISTKRGPQIGGQKTESYFSNKSIEKKETRNPANTSEERIAFPASGSIYYSRWQALVRTHSTGTTPDADVVARAFRTFCRDRNIPLDAPKIEERFIKIVQKFRI